MQQLKKIVIIGPESTGKSTLCEGLAAHYKTEWAKEYAREFLLANGNTYTYEDLLDVAKGQLMLEDRAAEIVLNKTCESGNVPLLFIDTDMYVMKVWCEFVFDKCHQWIINQVVSRQYDLYLLCNTDLPWVKDELREYPDLESRLRLYHMYKDSMINQRINWVDISGTHEKRFEKAKDAVTRLL